MSTPPFPTPPNSSFDPQKFESQNVDRPNEPTGSSPLGYGKSELAAFAELRRVQSAGRWQVFGVLGVAAFMFGTFAISTYEQTKANFANDKISAAAAAEVPNLTPLVSAEFGRVAQNVLPVYREAAIEKYHQLVPELSTAAVVRLKQLPQEAGLVLGGRLLDALDRVVAKVQPEIEQTFPSLVNDETRDVITQQFMDALQEKNIEVADHIDATFTNQLQKLHAVLEKFEVTPATDDTAEAATRLQLMRTLLSLAELEIETVSAPLVSGGTIEQSTGEVVSTYPELPAEQTETPATDDQQPTANIQP